MEEFAVISILFFSHACQVVDISNVSPNWNKISWLFSQDIGSFSIGPTPTSAAMVKMLSMGEMKVYAFCLQRAKDSMVDLNALMMQDNIKDSMDKLSRSADFLKCTLTKGEVLYIPQGWYVLEVAHKGPLCYGVRKSFLIDTVEGKASYTKAKDMFAKDGREVDKMLDILKCFPRSSPSSDSSAVK